MTDIPLFPGPRVVKLLDGTLVFNDSEPYRHEQEARAILVLSALARAEAMFDIDRTRGPEVAAALSRTMREIEALAAP